MNCACRCARGGDLRAHVKRVHRKDKQQRDKDKPCPHCDYRTTNGASLADHVKAVHERIKDLK